jgi:arsenite methyltransferase
MSDQIRFDDEVSRAVEQTYKTADVVEQRRAIIAALELRPGERVLDIGSGPGFLAQEMAAAGARVHGVDPSPSMLDIARRRAPDVTFSEGTAIELAFADASFDVVVSTQVYEYVEDMAAELAEVRRVLVPGGRLLILDTDWDSIVWRSSDDERMARVLHAWDAHLVHRDLPRYLPEWLAAAGFDLQRSAVVPILNIGYERETYSGYLVETVARFVGDASAWAADLRAMGPSYFFSLNRYLFRAISLDHRSNLS